MLEWIWEEWGDRTVTNRSINWIIMVVRTLEQVLVECKALQASRKIKITKETQITTTWIWISIRIRISAIIRATIQTCNMWARWDRWTILTWISRTIWARTSIRTQISILNSLTRTWEWVYLQLEMDQSMATMISPTQMNLRVSLLRTKMNHLTGLGLHLRTILKHRVTKPWRLTLLPRVQSP